MENTTEMMSIEAVQQVVERILANAFACVVHVTVTRITDEERRNQVYRCEIQGDHADLPSSAIVKQALHGNGIFNDWAGVQFLSQLDASISPRYYGGDRQTGLLLIEDIKDAKGIHDILLEGTAIEARTILCSFARALGQMHAHTIGREPEYRAIRTELASVDPANKQHDIADDARRMFAEIADQVDIQVDEAFYAELSGIGRKMHAPGPFYAFSHGDPCPDNWLCDGETTKLIDYEFAGYKHALLDGVYGHIMFPTCWCVGLIPATLVAEMEDIYRKELMQGCAAAADDATFQAELFAACAYWTWNTLRGLLKNALEERQTWGIASTRARIVSRLAALLAMAERNDSSQYPAFVAASQRLYALVSALWPEEKLQLYPCFQEK